MNLPRLPSLVVLPCQSPLLLACRDVVNRGPPQVLQDSCAACIMVHIPEWLD
jgi:hypothetical protein